MSSFDSSASEDPQILARTLFSEEEKLGFGLCSVLMCLGIGSLGERKQMAVVLKELGPSDAIFKIVLPFENRIAYQQKCYGTKIYDDSEEEEEVTWHPVNSLFPGRSDLAVKYFVPNAKIASEFGYKVRRQPFEFKRLP